MPSALSSTGTVYCFVRPAIAAVIRRRKNTYPATIEDASSSGEETDEENDKSDELGNFNNRSASTCTPTTGYSGQNRIYTNISDAQQSSDSVSHLPVDEREDETLLPTAKKLCDFCIGDALWQCTHLSSKRHSYARGLRYSLCTSR